MFYNFHLSPTLPRTRRADGDEGPRRGAPADSCGAALQWGTMRNVVIAGAARTPIGSFQGELAGLTAPQLGSVAIRAALERAADAADQVGEVYQGCVLPAGQGRAPARQASMRAGVPA